MIFSLAVFSLCLKSVIKGEAYSYSSYEKLPLKKKKQGTIVLFQCCHCHDQAAIKFFFCNLYYHLVMGTFCCYKVLNFPFSNSLQPFRPKLCAVPKIKTGGD